MDIQKQGHTGLPPAVRLLICGANGKMGQVVRESVAPKSSIETVAGVDLYPDIIKNPFPVYDSIKKCQEEVDVIIDFSRPEALVQNLEYAAENSVPMVIATTGFSEEQIELIHEYSKKVPLFFSANMSLGVNLQMDLAKRAATFLGDAFDVEIIEKHHNLKVDSPSGTALALADAVNSAFIIPKEYVHGRHSKTQKRTKGEIGLHAVRGGTIVGEHEILFIGKDEIFQVNHIAQSKQIFAVGAIKAAEFLVGKAPSLYSMKDIVGEHSAVTSINTQKGQAIISIRDLDNSVGSLAEVFSSCSHINLDMICQTSKEDGLVDLSFSLPQEDLESGLSALKEIMPADRIKTIDTVTKITLQGMGMEFKPGIAAKLFSCLAEDCVNVQLITTSETKIALCVDNDVVNQALHAISKAFPL